MQTNACITPCARSIYDLFNSFDSYDYGSLDALVAERGGFVYLLLVVLSAPIAIVMAMILWGDSQ